MRKPKPQPMVTFTLLPYTFSVQQEATWLELWDRISRPMDKDIQTATIALQEDAKHAEHQ